ncbi:ATP-dependent helicase/nuclease subunit A [Limihaloglobus sulfuriphilus]|uniref:DNA 3'-5' helicase n=1 Tax=Limihaloglobus sulfuriphilus TaxID=1851148 RepID=A0A1Q2MCB1_9BACT|nr:UvrD-helicase domain-containing protein [Limihaloglobus sulfuriphilus]AQQ70304.1 ATP-dependent helicase/nuclease subunit A [Limihaloglobus sulfuriphilus]
MKYTQDQQAAIDARGNVLVTASAGTGKTAVLAQRCLELVLNGTDLDRILVVTFTEAAAAEMKIRIEQKLRSEVSKEDTGKRNFLRRQILKIDNARISTIHSFCRRLIVEHYNEIGLDPSFKVIDQDELMLIKTEVMESVLEDAWQRREMVESMGQLFAERKIIGSSDFTNAFISVADKLESVPCRDSWYERILNTEPCGENDTTAKAELLQIATFVELLKMYDKALAKKKQIFNCLDYSDLQLWAWKLLYGGDGRLSKAAEDIAGRFQYTFVDEYQDVSDLQDAIIRAVSPRELFIVGDVKQSIYMFREARPQIFLDYIKDAESGSSGSVLIPLNINFRSRQKVLDFVNVVFKRLMHVETSGMVYDSKAVLTGGLDYKPLEQDKPPVEVHLITQSAAEPSKTKYSKYARQAKLIAERIKRMVAKDGGRAEFQVMDKNTGDYRDVRYEDIAVLMYSVKSAVNEYLDVFAAEGIPVATDFSREFFQRSEISTMVSLLRVLDNQYNDIDMAAVLRSPLVRLTDIDLARIAGCANYSDSFCEAIRRYSCEFSDELSAGIKKAMDNLDTWRKSAIRRGLSDMIWDVYRETGYLSFVLALPEGRQRRANLVKFHERAVQFENFLSSSSQISLSRFVRFIDQLSQNKNEWHEASLADTAAGVKITTIHKSKGLEYPVVFAASLERQIPLSENKEDWIFDLELGLGLKITRDYLRERGPLYKAVEQRQKSDQLAESIRQLYVTFTRARERLILVSDVTGGTVKPEKWLNPDDLDSEKLFSPAAMLSQPSYARWLIGCFSDQLCVDDLQPSEEPRVVNSSLFSICSHDRIAVEESLESLLNQRPKTEEIELSIDTENIEAKACRIIQPLLKGYAYSEFTRLPAKQSVSALTHENDEFRQFFEKEWKKHPSDLTAAAGEKADPLEVGSAVHLIFEKADVSQGISMNYLESLLQGLVSKKLISEGVSAVIDLEGVLEFFQHESFKQLMACSEAVYREWPFTFSASPREFGVHSGGDGDNVIIQGIVDMIIDRGEDIVIVDFKTDRVDSESISHRAELYRKQLEFYSRAAAAVLKKPVSRLLLYFVSSRSFYEL